VLSVGVLDGWRRRVRKKPEQWKNRIVGITEEDPSQLLANCKNWRIHPKNQQDALNGVLNDIGFVTGVIQNDRNATILDGHLRCELAISKGQKTIPVIHVDLTEAEEAEVLATFDPISAMAAADKEKLDDLLKSIQSDDEQVMKLLEEIREENGIIEAPVITEDEAPIDKAEELQKKWQVTRGQVWEVPSLTVKGKGHRVMCGDSTDAGDVELLLGNDKPILMVTDPPYGVEYDANWRNEAAASGHLSHADRAIGQVTNDNRLDWSEAYSLFAGDVAYAWHADRHAKEVQESLEKCGFEIVCQIIWAKPVFVISRGDYHWKHEPCWYAVRKGKKHNWQGSRSETTVWPIERGCKEKTGHSTEKPIECMAKPILNNTAKGESCYDPFLGSGTTLIAAEQTGRICMGMEIAEKYVSVCLQRFVNNGLEPRLSGA
jgi:DNA modification methylase